ncbi:MAG: FtsW/RodA/SpoVE family cell cycle protein [Candidatus Faecimonas sp.]|nr:FtsW/RodA/SpoVE family cell cycle protein [Mycoplasmatota bacterium]MDY2908062.1 FtsW/RodA/SpoVE family cell cycle protein [Candidatus Faecimonas sp.]
MTVKKLNKKILIPICIMAAISIVTIYSALTYTSSELGNLALKQALWYIIGSFLVAFLIHMKNEYLYRHTIFLYILGNLLLLGLLLFAEPVNNSKCWFTIPGIGSLQPSEFMKIFIMLMLATMIHNFRSDYTNPTLKQEFIFILKTLVIVLIPSILTFLQPDTGAVIIYFIIYFCMMFASGIRIRWFLIAGGVFLLLLAIIFGIFFLQQDLFINLFGTDLFYRFERIFNWQSGTGLQLENALAAIGSAGFFGHGFNHTPIYFPESSTDFIFAVYASNFGLLGVIILLTLIVYFDSQIILLAKRKLVDTDKYILAGILGMLLFQQVQNIGMTVGLLPITGITLPFISYGGSSLLSYMVIVGIILNISMEKARHYKYR